LISNNINLCIIIKNVSVALLLYTPPTTYRNITKLKLVPMNVPPIKLNRIRSPRSYSLLQVGALCLVHSTPGTQTSLQPIVPFFHAKRLTHLLLDHGARTRIARIKCLSHFFGVEKRQFECVVAAFGAGCPRIGRTGLRLGAQWQRWVIAIKKIN